MAKRPRKCLEPLQRQAAVHDLKLTVRGLIEQSNVAMVGTTDDPIDSLEWHKKIKEDPTIKVVVLPRPSAPTRP